jgi:hypothetical protein
MIASKIVLIGQTLPILRRPSVVQTQEKSDKAVMRIRLTEYRALILRFMALEEMFALRFA